MMAYLCLGGITPPELGHGNRFPSVQISLLQQFGGRTFTRTGRRCLVHGLPEYLTEILDFSPVIQHPELFE